MSIKKIEPIWLDVYIIRSTTSSHSCNKSNHWVCGARWQDMPFTINCNCRCIERKRQARYRVMRMMKGMPALETCDLRYFESYLNSNAKIENAQNLLKTQIYSKELSRMMCNASSFNRWITLSAAFHRWMCRGANWKSTQLDFRKFFTSVEASLFAI